MENTVTLTKEQASEIFRGMLHLQTNIQLLMARVGDLAEDTEGKLRETTILISSITASHLQLETHEIESVIEIIKADMLHAEELSANAEEMS